MSLLDKEITLTAGQKKALDTAMSGVNCFITGGAGTGKSFVVRRIISELEQAGKNIVAVAPTGIAASVIGGVTIHRGFGFPASCCITEKTLKVMVRVSDPLLVADVVIIDEVSMVRMDLFDSMIASIRKAEKKSGRQKQIIVIGDFCQLAPFINEKNGERKLLQAHYRKVIRIPFAFLGNEWDKCNFVPVILTDIVRQADAELINNLNLARMADEGCRQYFNSRHQKAPIPNAVYMYARNDDVDAENLKQLNLIPGRNYEFETIFDGMLNSEDVKDIPRKVILKPGARVMVTTNDTNGVYTDYAEHHHKRVPYERDKAKFFNGTMGTVVSLGKYECQPEREYVVVHLDTGLTLFFYRQSYPVYEYVVDDNNKIQRRELGGYRQFPLRPAYAVTYHKSQGQTYDKVNLDPYCSYSGQLYVGLSRVTSISGLHLMHEIECWNLALDPLVKEFYNNLKEPKQTDELFFVTRPLLENETETDNSENINVSASDTLPEPKVVSVKPIKRRSEKKKGTAPTPKGGRPSRYPSGSSVVRMPIELASLMEKAIDLLYPLPSEGSPDRERIERLVIAIQSVIEQ